MVGFAPSIVVTGKGDSGFDSGEGAYYIQGRQITHFRHGRQRVRSLPEVLVDGGGRDPPPRRERGRASHATGVSVAG